MSKKQRECIDWICNVLSIEFTGTTKKEAWEFINKYKDQAQDVQTSIHNSFGYYDEWDYEMHLDEGSFC